MQAIYIVKGYVLQDLSPGRGLGDKAEICQVLRRVRQLRTAIEYELRSMPDDDVDEQNVKEQKLQFFDAKN